MSTNEDLAYLAGLFEGDGCVGLYRYGKYDHYRFSIGNTNLDVLKWSKKVIKNVTGNNISIRLYKGNSGLRKTKQMYYLDTGNKYIISDVLQKLLPYMKMEDKIEKANEIISRVG